MANGGVPIVRAQLRCAGCGDVIGVYERLLVEHDDGTLYSSSVLSLSERDHVRGARLWHLGCAAL